MPYASEQWYLLAASAENRKKGINGVDMAKYGQLKAENMVRTDSQDLVVTLLNEKIEPSFYGYGIEKLNAVLSTQTCNDKELFITIFMHEFGHILNATHDKRGNTHYDADLGTHCTNDKCIMGESGYIGLTQERLERKKKNQPPFCDECIASMRATLENMPGLVKAVAVSHDNALPVLPHNNDNWKDGWRKHYQAVAARDKAVYHEDAKIRILWQILLVQTVLSSTWKPTTNTIYPWALFVMTEQTIFRALRISPMWLPRPQKITARLNLPLLKMMNSVPAFLIACLEAQPRMKTKGAPSITPAFLKNIDAQTKQRLEKAIQANQPAKPRSKPRPRPGGNSR